MDEKGGKALSGYQRKLSRALQDMTPWRKKTSRLGHLRGKVKPGEVVVVLDAGESADHPLYKDATIIRSD